LTSALTGLAQPVHITHAGDGSGRIFIVERAGRIRIASGGTVLPAPFLDISGAVRDAGSEQGLLSVAFPPDYAAKGYFYVYYTDDRAANRGNNVLSRFHLGADANTADPASEETILTFPHPTYDNHNGGQLAFGPEGYLYIGTGDGGSGGEPGNNAQNTLSLLGKILRIDVGDVPRAPPPALGPFVLYLPAVFAGVPVPYTIPVSNPFLGNPAYRGEIWALGLRNPWRFSFDRATGDLYIGDVGQSAREEVDLQPAASAGGENYGWRCKEGSLSYNFGGNCPNLTLVAPVAGYDHSSGNCSISGGYVYRGPGNLLMQGVYFYADYCSGRIWGLQPDGAAWVTSLLLDSPYNLSSFGEDEAGNLYLASYSTGAIYQVNQAP
jgi:glucose/arabinose dehydrogenase